MSWSILLLPLLGGYYFLSRSIRWKYYYRRIERQRLIFDSLLVAVIFFSAGYSIWFFVGLIDPIQTNHFVLKASVSIPYFYPCLLALILSIIYTTIFNKVNEHSENWYLSQVIEKTGNSLQRDFLQSYFFDKVVMITLKNGKIYVGLISELHEPQPEHSFVRLILFYSGYRDNSMDVILQKDYNLNIDTSKDEEGQLVTNVVAESEILSMTFYDQKIYDRLNDNNQ